MTALTRYGTWVTYADRLMVEDTIHDFVGTSPDADWYKRIQRSGALERMAEDFRAAVNAALPEGTWPLSSPATTPTGPDPTR